MKVRMKRQYEHAPQGFLEWRLEAGVVVEGPQAKIVLEAGAAVKLDADEPSKEASKPKGKVSDARKGD